MENDILKFSESISVNKEGGENIASYTPEKYNLYLCRVAVYSMPIFYPPNKEIIIALDEEDVKYFENKYLPKLEDQYEKELGELNKKFNKDISGLGKINITKENYE